MALDLRPRFCPEIFLYKSTLRPSTMVFSLSSMVSARFTTFGVDLGVGSASDSKTDLVAERTVICFYFSWRCSFSDDWTDCWDGADPEEIDLMNCLIILSLNFWSCLLLAIVLLLLAACFSCYRFLLFICFFVCLLAYFRLFNFCDCLVCLGWFVHKNVNTLCI